MRTLVAIDPGQNGGIAMIYVDKDYSVNNNAIEGIHWKQYVSAINMPDTVKDIIDILTNAKRFNIPGDYIIYLEEVHSMPGQGVASSFKFGRGFGNLEAIAICLGYRLIYVRPQVWQKALGLLTKKDETKTEHKNRIKAFAQQRYPDVKVTLATADALAILEYAKEKEK